MWRALTRSAMNLANYGFPKPQGLLAAICHEQSSTCYFDAAGVSKQSKKTPKQTKTKTKPAHLDISTDTDDGTSCFLMLGTGAFVKLRLPRFPLAANTFHIPYILPQMELVAFKNQN